MATHFAPNAEPVDTSRFECLSGQLLERPLPTVIHAELQSRVLDLLRQHGKELGFKALAEVSLEESTTSRNEWLTPDVLVAAGHWFEQKATGNAIPPVLLAVEILSAGQTFFNMRSKVKTMFRWGVSNVWLVDHELLAVMVFNEVKPDVGHVVFDGMLDAGDLAIQLSDIFELE